MAQNDPEDQSKQTFEASTTTPSADNPPDKDIFSLQLHKVESDEIGEEKQLRGSKIVFLIICFTNMLINIDHGVIPAATDEIKADLNMTNSQLGVLGSLVYFGVVCASFVAGKLYLKYTSKYVCMIALASMVATLVAFTQLTTITALYFFRFLTGAAQVFMLVYFPVWVDLYGCENKTIWISLLQAGVPMGVFVGYALTAAVSEDLGWRWAIYIQCFSMVPTLLIFTFCKAQDIEVNATKIEEAKTRSIAQDSVFSKPLSTNEIADQNDLEEPCSSPTLDSPSSKEKALVFYDLLKILWKSKIYLFSLFSVSILYFIVTGLQFWMSDYFKNVLLANESEIYLTYALISLTGPTLGVVVGGIVSQKIGGYEHINAKIMCFILSCFAGGVACPVPFLKSFYLTAFLIWVLLFLGGAMVPSLTGMMLCSVEPEFRAFANSNSQTIQNLLGFLPAPTLYGLMSEYVDPRAGMLMLMYSTLLGVFLASLIYFFSKRQLVSAKVTLDSLREGLLQQQESNASSEFDDQNQAIIVASESINNNNNKINLQINMESSEADEVESKEARQKKESHKNGTLILNKPISQRNIAGSKEINISGGEQEESDSQTDVADNIICSQTNNTTLFAEQMERNQSQGDPEVAELEVNLTRQKSNTVGISNIHRLNELRRKDKHNNNHNLGVVVEQDENPRRQRIKRIRQDSKDIFFSRLPQIGIAIPIFTDKTFK